MGSGTSAPHGRFNQLAWTRAAASLLPTEGVMCIALYFAMRADHATGTVPAWVTRAALAWLRRHAAGATTVVSYSDPAAGHDGALYRACGWLWAPTWHRLRPPPSGNGAWTAAGGAEAVKDRWIYPLTPDAGRVAVLAVKDAAIANAMPWACYREPRWKRGRPVLDTGGGNHKRWRAQFASAQEAAAA